jgi:flagellin
MDTNYAFETAALAKQMVLLNAGQAMLAMANQSGKEVLSLLR